VEQKREAYDDAYGNWSKQDVSRADLLKLSPAEAKVKIEAASKARETVQKTRQDYLATLRTSYEKTAQDIDDKAKVSGLNVKAIQEQYDRQLNALTQEKGTIQAELDSIEKDNGSAASIYRGHLKQRIDAINQLVLELVQDKGAVTTADGSPERIDNSRRLLKQDLRKLTEALGASSKTSDDAGEAWKKYYASLEDEIANPRPSVPVASAKPPVSAPPPSPEKAAAPENANPAAAETVKTAPAPPASAELFAHLPAFTGKWTFHNDNAPMPTGKKGKKLILTQWSEKDVELNLDAMGLGTFHYAIEPGSFDVKPLDFTFRLDSWDGQKFLGTLRQGGATGTIFIYPTNGKVQVGWVLNVDPDKEFTVTNGGATLSRP
jgi:hypothetical protein